MERNRANFTQANQIDEKGKNLEKNSTSPSPSPMTNLLFPSSSPNKSRKKENFAQISSTSDTSPISSTSDTSPTSSTSSNLPPSSISSPNSPLKLELTPTSDGSFTARHPIYDQCYHSREGAITESYYKHFLPAFQWWKFKNGDNHPSHLKILDICFGLGYNIWVTLLHRPPQTRLHIVSPELDREVVEQIREFPYPPQLEPIKPIILEISKNLGYKDKFVEIEVKIGDAREIVQKAPSHFFDVCYQDPFSPKVNPELWTIEFFQTLSQKLHHEGVLTTYSVATPVRCALFKTGFHLYTHPYIQIRPGTIALRNPSAPFPKVDFKTKLTRTQCRYLTQTPAGKVEVEREEE